MNTLYYVGIDVSKARLDFSSKNSKPFCIPNEPAPIITHLKKLPANSCLIIESTGGYERQLVRAAHSLNLKWKVVNPARVRAFAVSKGQLGKTDPLDAALLREFGECHSIQPDEGLDLNRSQLAELVSARDQIVLLQTQITNFLEHAEGVARSTFSSLKNLIVARLEKLEAAIRSHIEKSEQLHARFKTLTSTDGVGQTTASVLLAYLPELGDANRQKISSLAGLAPHPNDSGDHKGLRFIKGGRPRVRRALFMAVLSAIRSKSPLAAFYKRLRNAGKPAKVAMIAAARKLLVFLNSSLKNQPA